MQTVVLEMISRPEPEPSEAERAAREANRRWVARLVEIAKAPPDADPTPLDWNLPLAA